MSVHSFSLFYKMDEADTVPSWGGTVPQSETYP